MWKTRWLVSLLVVLLGSCGSKSGLNVAGRDAGRGSGGDSYGARPTMVRVNLLRRERPSDEVEMQVVMRKAAILIAGGSLAGMFYLLADSLRRNAIDATEVALAIVLSIGAFALTRSLHLDQRATMGHVFRASVVIALAVVLRSFSSDSGVLTAMSAGGSAIFASLLRSSSSQHTDSTRASTRPPS